MQDVGAARQLLENIHALTKRATEIIQIAADGEKPVPPEPYSNMFGDTLLYAWNLSGKEQLWFPSLFCQYLVVDGMIHSILLRGAIGVGDAIQQQGIMLGPGVTDAAAWYDQLDASGVVVTPKLGLLVEETRELVKDPTVFRQHYASSRVPLRGSRAQVMWTAPWPYTMVYMAAQDGRPPRRVLLQLLQKHEVPSGTESKYEHTINYYDEWVGAGTP